MTKVTFFKRDGVYFGFRETGHTGYGESGNDILCAALSAMTMLIVNTIEVAYDARVDYTIDDGAATITVKVPEILSDDGERRFAISGLLMGYMVQLADMQEEHYEFISVDEDENENI